VKRANHEWTHLIKLKGSLWILDSDHCMVETEVFGPSDTGHFCGLRMLRIIVKTVRIKNSSGCGPIDVRARSGSLGQLLAEL
jgi:hypothetical protein